MSKKQSGAQRMRAEIKSAAEGLHRAGIVSAATLAKVTARDVDMSKLPRVKAPSGAEIVAMRARANMSQAVFARFLNVAISTLSQWEREEKRPRGAAARLLAIVNQKGIAAVL